MQKPSAAVNRKEVVLLKDSCVLGRSLKFSADDWKFETHTKKLISKKKRKNLLADTLLQFL